jgi:glutamate-ammonia-ligase adenylyltransferase
MSDTQAKSGWNILPPVTVPAEDRLDHVRSCSDFAAGLLDRFPDWAEGLDESRTPDSSQLAQCITDHGLDPGLRRFRNRSMLRIVWRDLCGVAPLAETFASLTALAGACLQAAIAEHHARLEAKHGVPRGADGSPQGLSVIGLGKFGGGELNLSSDIDIVFCYPQSGSCDGRRGLANDQFFTRLARAVIASLADITEDGFCFRVDTRLRPFGNAGPVTTSLAAMEQYYQREGRDWERYALIKARPVAGDLATGAELIERLRPFVYRRYIDYGSVEALQEMHASVVEDAMRKDRLDDIKRGPGGIREIEFLAQCFQILRGGREPGLQTPSLDVALAEIEKLELLDHEAVTGIRNDYVFLRLLENRIQALRDQQTHRLPEGEDRGRIAKAMYEESVAALDRRLERTRQRVSERFHGIFPERPEPKSDGEWAERWRSLRASLQDSDELPGAGPGDPMTHFLRRLQRIALSQRAHQRLDRFMPELMGRLDRKTLDERTLNRVFDLVLSVCRRSAYLVLLVQQPRALDRMLELFERSEWVADKVIRFPALLDELIDPALGRFLPSREDLARNVTRILEAAPGTEAVLANLNYLKLANELRIAVGQLQGSLDGEQARTGRRAAGRSPRRSRPGNRRPSRRLSRRSRRGAARIRLPPGARGDRVRFAGRPGARLRFRPRSRVPVRGRQGSLRRRATAASGTLLRAARAARTQFSDRDDPLWPAVRGGHAAAAQRARGRTGQQHQRVSGIPVQGGVDLGAAGADTGAIRYRQRTGRGALQSRAPGSPVPAPRRAVAGAGTAGDAAADGAGTR